MEKFFSLVSLLVLQVFLTELVEVFEQFFLEQVVKPLVVDDLAGDGLVWVVS